MPGDDLEKVLQQADATYSPSIGSATQLIGGAVKVYQRNRRRRRIVTTACIVCVCSIFFAAMRHSRSQRQTTVANVGDTRQLLADSQKLSVAISNQKLLVETMEAVDRKAAADRDLKMHPPIDAVQKLDDERERFALALLQQAAAAPKGVATRAIYQQVAENFPGTGAAIVAQNYLFNVPQ